MSFKACAIVGAGFVLSCGEAREDGSWTARVLNAASAQNQCGFDTREACTEADVILPEIDTYIQEGDGSSHGAENVLVLTPRTRGFIRFRAEHLQQARAKGARVKSALLRLRVAPNSPGNPLASSVTLYRASRTWYEDASWMSGGTPLGQGWLGGENEPLIPMARGEPEGNPEAGYELTLDVTAEVQEILALRRKAGKRESIGRGA